MPSSAVRLERLRAGTGRHGPLTLDRFRVLLADHAEIRAAAQDFEQRLAAKTPVGAEAMAHLAKLLHDHVRLEEKEVFPRIEKVLGEQGLKKMGRGLTRLHSKDEVCDI